MKVNFKLIPAMAACILVGALSAAIVLNPRLSEKEIMPAEKAVPVVEFDVPQERAPVGTAILYGRITDVSTKKSSSYVSFGLVEWVIGSDNQEQAAFEDGTCTLERIEQDNCSLAGFYMRDTHKTITLPIIEEPSIRVMARNGALGFRADKTGNIYQEEVTLNDFVKILDTNDFSIIPFIITTSGGAVVSIQEQYLP